jgi:histidine triad (HIT) family protein
MDEAEVEVEANCTFCRVRDGLLHSQIVLDEAGVLAFLDHSPLFPGHVLVIPRRHYRNLFELPVDEVGPIFATSQRLAKAVKAAMDADGIFIASNNGVSQSVDHFHIHVVPRNKKDGLRGFMWPRRKYDSDEHAAEVASSIRQALLEVS